ncbi:MAG: hypothetical protein N2Z20_04680, partial [Elusimicrobiales bacterium]|nr:hypothetical protein [Elusimicrobiales bacterium]
MKKILSLVAAAAMLSSVASAEVLKNFKYDGSVEINAYSVNNADFNKDLDDNDNETRTRVILNMGFDLNEDVRAEITAIKNNRVWNNTSESAITGALDSFNFDQAYLNLKGVLGMDHKVGRQFYGKPEDLVIYFGPKYWPYDNLLSADAIDAWVGNYKYNDYEFTAILGKEKLGTSGNDDIDIKGIDAKTKINDYNLNAYYYEEIDRNTTPNQPSYLGLFGI